MLEELQTLALVGLLVSTYYLTVGCRKISEGIPEESEAISSKVASATEVLDDIANLLGVNYVWLPDRHYSLMRLRNTWRFTYSPEQDQDVDRALSDPVARAHIANVSAAAAGATIRPGPTRSGVGQGRFLAQPKRAMRP